jgi:hypothetical protein
LNDIQFPITNGLSGIERVWVLLTPKTNTDTNQDTLPSYSSLPMGAMENVQLLIDNVSYYESPINDDHDFYRLFEEACVAGTSKTDSRSTKLISFEDWRRHHRIYCFDVSRKYQGDAPRSLRLTGKRKDVKISDVNFCLKDKHCVLEVYVEYRVSTSIDIATGSCSTNEQ